MNNDVKVMLAFIAGAAVGVAASWKYAKNKFEAQYQEDIKAIKRRFAQQEEMFEEYVEKTSERISDVADAARRNRDMREYASQIDKLDYTDYSSTETVKKGDENMIERPYVIPPEEYGELAGYTPVSLTYYEDGILADSCYNPIEDIDDIVGLDSLDTFGEYEDDSVYVRNDRLKCDYEILKDYRNFDEARDL